MPDCPNEAIVFSPDLCEKHADELDAAELKYYEWRISKRKKPKEINFPDQSVLIEPEV